MKEQVFSATHGTSEGVYCCNDHAAADFSLLTMPSFSAIDFTKPNLWLAIILVVLDPFYRPLVTGLEHKTRLLSKAFGENLAFSLYISCAFLHTAVTFVSFQKALEDQPWFDYFMTNQILVLAYGLFLLGITMKGYTVYCYGWSKIFGVMHFKTNIGTAKDDIPKSHLEPYYHPNGVASIICLTAISLLRASLAGCFICVIFALAYFTAFHLEKSFHNADWSSFMQKSHFTKIKTMERNIICGKDFKTD